jgi:hypothetical protein
LSPLAWKTKHSTISVDFDISALAGHATYVGEVDVQALELEVGGTIVPSQKYQTAIPRSSGIVEEYRRNLLAIAVKAVLASNGLPVVRVSTSFSFRHPIGGLSCCVGQFFGGRGTYQKAAPIWLPYKSPKSV